MANPRQHEDFGEKIGGARKDLWGERGLYTTDLDTMNEREASQYVKKDNVWKKPNYQAMIDSGIPVDVVYYIKKVRDSLIAAPRYYQSDNTPKKRLAWQAQYIETVRFIQSVVEAVRTQEDAINAFQIIMVDSEFVAAYHGISGTSYEFTANARKNPVITSKLGNILQIRSKQEFQYNFTNKARKEQFGVPKEERVPSGYEIHFNDGKHSFSQNNNWMAETYYVTKGNRILQKNLESRKAALEWIQDFAQKHRSEGKKRFVPRQLSRIRRNGPDYRGGRDIAGQDYLDTFGFRGGEFGNWMTQLDRRASLNMGYDALKDLAAALQISDRDISYQGALSIAFGARGSGGAVAHYEPMRKVINLTKMRGAGSLAHEWWHGLDDFLGEKMGVNGYLSENPKAYPLFQRLIDTIKYKPASPEQAAQIAQQNNERLRGNVQAYLDSWMLQALQRSKDSTIMERYNELKTAFLNGESGIQKLSELRKEACGHIIPQNACIRLMAYIPNLKLSAQQMESQATKIETDYYRESKRMAQENGKDGDYWDSNVEMTARAFATYTMDLLPYRSDYLNGHAECAVSLTTDKDGSIDIIKAYPQEDERAAINAVFDEIVEDLKRQHYLTHEDRPLLAISEAEKATVAAEYERLSSNLSHKRDLPPQR